MASDKKLNFILKLLLVIGIPLVLMLSHLNASSRHEIRMTRKELALTDKGSLPKSSLKSRIQFLEPKVKPRLEETLRLLKEERWKMALVIYKTEKLVEVWSDGPKKKKIKTYKMRGFSGELGPKNRQGDMQIPEGIYHTTHLNQNSAYYLSIGINYPNSNDRKRAQRSRISDPGGDIFIHGRRVTIGCVPIGDHWIEELFYLVHRAGASKVKVVIAPSRLPLPSFAKLNLDTENDLLRRKYADLSAELTDYASGK